MANDYYKTTTTGGFHQYGNPIKPNDYYKTTTTGGYDQYGNPIKLKPWEQKAANTWDRAADRRTTRAGTFGKWQGMAQDAGRDRIADMWGNLSQGAETRAGQAQDWQTYMQEGRQGESPLEKRKREWEEKQNRNSPYDYDREKDRYREKTRGLNDQLQNVAEDFSSKTQGRIDSRDAEFSQYGPLGERYGARELETMDNFGRMGGADYKNEWGGNALDFTKNMIC